MIVEFRGINYRADIICNKRVIATGATVVGTFRYFSFDLTSAIVYDQPNQLEVVITPPVNSPWNSSTIDLAMTFVDWTPFPPDQNLGLWREVYVTIVDTPVTLSSPLVASSVAVDLQSASLTVSVDVTNWSSQPITGVITIALPGVISTTLSQTVTINGGATPQLITFAPSVYASLQIAKPQLWWPYQMGSPTLHSLNITFTRTGSSSPSDTLHTRYGIRTVTSELTSSHHRLYRINGRPILIRGGGYSPDLLLTQEIDTHRLAQIMALTKDLGLNTIRFEGKFPTEAFFSMADQEGILMIVGWCCCDSWQHWKYWKAEQHLVASSSTRDQAKRLRIHASMVAFWYSSDDLPPVDVEKEYINALMVDAAWPNPILASASDRTSKVSGATGVKMSGPYAWVPPNYW